METPTETPMENEENEENEEKKENEANEEKSAGEVEAQRNCKAHHWILPIVFGLGRVLLMLYHIQLLDQSVNKKKNSFIQHTFSSPLFAPIMVGVLSVLGWALIYA